MPPTPVQAPQRATEQVDLRQPSEAVPRLATVCSVTVVALMVVESAVGLLAHGLYDEAPWAIAALRGNDLVTLLVVAPLLALAVARGRTSAGWRLVWLGALFYGVYNFAYYALGTSFNDVFLLHVASLALSITASCVLASHLDVDAIALRMQPALRVDRIIATYLLFVGGALVAAWGGLSLRFAVTGVLPRDVMPTSAVHLVYALDLSLLAPAFLSGGLLLWRRRAWGYALGVAVNVFGALYLLVLEVVGGFEADAGIEGKTWFSPPAVVGAIACGMCAAALLRRLRPEVT